MFSLSLTRSTNKMLIEQWQCLSLIFRCLNVMPSFSRGARGDCVNKTKWRHRQYHNKRTPFESDIMAPACIRQSNRQQYPFRCLAVVSENVNHHQQQSFPGYEECINSSSCVFLKRPLIISNGGWQFRVSTETHFSKTVFFPVIPLSVNPPDQN